MEFEKCVVDAIAYISRVSSLMLSGKTMRLYGNSGWGVATPGLRE